MKTVKIKTPSYKEYKVGGEMGYLSHAVHTQTTNIVLAVFSSHDMAVIFLDAWCKTTGNHKEHYKISQVYQE